MWRQMPNHPTLEGIQGKNNEILKLPASGFHCNKKLLQQKQASHSSERPEYGRRVLRREEKMKLQAAPDEL